MLVAKKTQNSAKSTDNTLVVSTATLRDVLTSQQLYEAFARNLKEMRAKKGFKSAHALAVTIPGMSATTVKAMEKIAEKKGRTYPRLDKIELVAERLNCDVWELFHPDTEGLHQKLDRLSQLEEFIQKMVGKP